MAPDAGEQGPSYLGGNDFTLMSNDEGFQMEHMTDRGSTRPEMKKPELKDDTFPTQQILFS